jgi:hypothetical protein
MLPLADAFVGWLGSNTTSQRGVTEVNLVVGVRSEDVEKRIDDLTGRKVVRFLQRFQFTSVTSCHEKHIIRGICPASHRATS